MAKNANPTLVGSFVVGATVLTLGGILAFGSGDFLEEESMFIAYFDSSVDGLDVGAPIKYRGVEVGTVTRIHAVWDPAVDTIKIPVELTFTGDSVEKDEGEFAELTPEDSMARLIDLGLRATLQKGSFVTGKLFVGMDFHAGSPAHYHDDGHTPYPEIPTMEGGLERLFKDIEQLPIGELVEDLAATVAELRAMVAAPELKEVIPNLNRLVTDMDAMVKSTDARLATLADAAGVTLDDTRSLLKTVESEVEPLSQSTQVTMADIRTLVTDVDAQVQPLSRSLDETLASIRVVMGRIDDATGGDYTLRFQLRDLLEEAAQAMRNIQALSTYLQQRPEALLTGKK